MSNVIITLSTTSKTESGGSALSTTYADNVGANVQTVYSGAITLTTTTTDAPGGTTKVFDSDIPLQSAFAYSPSAGNLLVDITIPNGATVSGGGFGFVTFDNANTAGDGLASVVNISSGSSATGTVGSDGAIAQFTTVPVPEPATFSLLSVTALALLTHRRRAQVTVKSFDAGIRRWLICAPHRPSAATRILKYIYECGAIDWYIIH